MAKKARQTMVRLKCTLCTGTDSFKPGAIVGMDEAEADKLAASGYVEIVTALPAVRQEKKSETKIEDDENSGGVGDGDGDQDNSDAKSEDDPDA